VKIDFKHDLLLAILLFFIIGTCYVTMKEIGHLKINLNGYKVENHDMRKRIDLLDDKIFDLNKRLNDLNN
jgi:hypothetical protein